MRIYYNRIEMVDLLIEDTFKCIELGVLKGDFSEVLYKKNPMRLDLVDKWDFENLCFSGNQDGNDCMMYDMRECYGVVCNKFHGKNNVNIIKSESIKFLNSVEDNFYDFAYLDTSHDYVGTLKELELLYHKVKPGGYITGHDFDTGELCNNRFDFEVDRAVYEFCIKYNQRIQGFAMDGCISFVICKR